MSVSCYCRLLALWTVFKVRCKAACACVRLGTWGQESARMDARRVGTPATATHVCMERVQWVFSSLSSHILFLCWFSLELSVIPFVFSFSYGPHSLRCHVCFLSKLFVLHKLFHQFFSLFTPAWSGFNILLTVDAGLKITEAKTSAIPCIHVLSVCSKA